MPKVFRKDHFWDDTVHRGSRRQTTEKGTKSLAQTCLGPRGREAGREATRYSNHREMQSQLTDISFFQDVGNDSKCQ